ncbi:MAG TPA: helix-turn-helix transcriptional regulator [Pyrinomonadaceae bacterium]|jgi:transcriptional regulator with XRE-family HTH domain
MGRAKKSRVEGLAKKLLEIREKLNLKQAELIKKLGLENEIYQGNISEYESGKRQPSLPVLLKYAQLAGVCLDVLVDDDLALPEKLPSTPKHKK